MVLRSHELPRDDFDDSDDGFEWSAAAELESGDRMCAPLEEPRGSTFWPAAIVIAVALTAGWIIAQVPAATQEIKDTASALVTANASEPAPIATPLASDAPAPPPLTADTTDVAAAPGASAGEAAAAVTEPDASASSETASEKATVATEEPTPEASDAAAPSESLPKPVADPRDPNRKRALAAGLHPDVSKALLARMTEADYSNARNAVDTALLQTGDGVLLWPTTGSKSGSKSGAALFEIKFVAGAAPGCRRYVVIITKDRWSTTAPPMEKCGDELPKRKLVRNGA